MSTPNGETPGIETKVYASTAATAVVGFLVWLLGAYIFKESQVPDEVVMFVGFIVNVVATFVAGYLAKHTFRAGETRRMM